MSKPACKPGCPVLGSSLQPEARLCRGAARGGDPGELVWGDTCRLRSGDVKFGPWRFCGVVSALEMELCVCREEKEKGNETRGWLKAALRAPCGPPAAPARCRALGCSIQGERVCPRASGEGLGAPGMGNMGLVEHWDEERSTGPRCCGQPGAGAAAAACPRPAGDTLGTATPGPSLRSLPRVGFSCHPALCLVRLMAPSVSSGSFSRAALLF